MQQSGTIVKILFLTLASLICLQTFKVNRLELTLISAIITTIIAFLFILFLYLQKLKYKISKRHIVPIVALPLLMMAFYARINYSKTTNHLPNVLQKLNPKEPNYNTSYIATLTILKEAGPARYHSQIQLLSKEKKAKRNYRRKRKLKYKLRYKPYKNRQYAYQKTSHFYKKKKHIYASKFYKQKTKKIKYKSSGYRKYRKNKNKPTYYKYSLYKSTTYKKRTYPKDKWIKKITYSKDSTEATPFNALIRIYKGRPFHKGCQLKIRIYGRAVPGPIPSSFKRYLFSEGLATSWGLSTKYHVISKTCPQMDIQDKINIKIQTIIKSSIEDTSTQSILIALLFGKSSYLNKNLKKQISQTGVMHIFAASGLHLGIFYLCFFIPLSILFGKKSILTIIFSLAPCLFFLFILGFPLSIVRAFIFICMHSIFSLHYQKLNKTTLILNSLIIILFLSPLKFLSIGNLLSFGAISGIFYFYKVINKILTFKSKILNLVWSQFCLSTSASLFTAPIVILVFGGHPSLSLLYNIILVPIIGLLLPLIYFTTGISLIMEQGLITHALFSTIEYIFSIIQQSIVDNPFYIKHTLSTISPIHISMVSILSLFLLKYIGFKNRHLLLSSYHIHQIKKIQIRVSYSRLKYIAIALFFLATALLSPAGILIYDSNASHKLAHNKPSLIIKKLR